MQPEVPLCFMHFLFSSAPSISVGIMVVLSLIRTVLFAQLSPYRLTNNCWRHLTTICCINPTLCLLQDASSTSTAGPLGQERHC